jgi:hypothetical protein
VAAAWRISQESFMENTKHWLYNLKLRLGYGMNGNDNIGTFLFGSTMTSFPTNFGTAYRMTRNANPDLKWEASVQYNAGLDFALFGGRVDLTLDLYYKTTKDMLLMPSLSPVLGFNTDPDQTWRSISAAYINAGRVDNKGIDIALNTVNIDGKNFKWNSNIVVSVNRNKVISLNDKTAVFYGNINQMTFDGNFTTVSMIKEGLPIGVFYGYQTDGIFTDADDLLNSAKPNLPIDRTSGIWIGDVKYKDISGPNGVPDGVINEYDKTVIGDPNPDFTFGFNNQFTYRGWELNIGLMGSVGGDILNYVKVKTEGALVPWDNQTTKVLNRAQIGYLDGDNSTANNGEANLSNSYLINPDATLPRYSQTGANNGLMSDRFIEDGSYLRIQNISLAYNFPKAWLGKAKIASLKIYFNAQNVWTFTKYSGLDPEIGSFSQNVLLSNIDLGRYPTPRIYTLGLNIAF